MFKDFLKSLLETIGPLLSKLLETLLLALIEKWTKSAAAAELLNSVDSAENLHAVMPKLLDTIHGEYRGLFERARFNRLATRLRHKAVTGAVWDHLVASGAVAGSSTGTSAIDLQLAVYE